MLFRSDIVKRLKLERTGCCKLAACSSVVALCLFIPTLFITCEELDIVGINIPYPNTNAAPLTHAISYKNTFLGEINSTCNNDCHCLRPASFEPVCWEEKQYTFFNPCLAGCQTATLVVKNETVHLADSYEFGNCSCVGDIKVDEVKLTEGACDRHCHLWPFLTAL